jgi:predicted ATPase
VSRAGHPPESVETTAADELGRLVHDALAHLADPASLQTHPLTHILVPEVRPNGSGRGRLLRQRILEGIGQLRPGPDVSSDAPARRAFRLLELRYVEGLSPAEVANRLALSRAGYFREHRRALDALVSLLAERWLPDNPGPAPDTALLPVDLSANSARSFDSLPIPVTSFVGREREIGAARDTLLRPEVRLLTLTGPGGIGKTRLAIEVAREAQDTFPDGVAFVPLAATRDPQMVPASVAQTLGIHQSTDRPLVEQIRSSLRPRTCLLVLDNLEHVLSAALLTTDLLTTCPKLKILATSRAILRVSGEHELVIPTLDVPPSVSDADPVEIQRSAAVRLFVERARAVRPDFAITAENATAIAAICRRLDGLPLAIELAAARVRLLTPEAILARLDRPLGLLVGGPRDAPDRQRTLQATIEWSYDLLSPDEQLLLRRLAVFVGGSTLEAAGAVVRGDASPGARETSLAPLSIDVLAGVEALVEHSLLREEGLSGEEERDLRFSMLETIREFALERLEASGEHDALRARHTAYFSSVLKQPGVGFASIRWFRRVESNHANLQIAWRWLVDHAQAERAYDMAANLSNYAFHRGDYVRGLSATEEVLARRGGAWDSDQPIIRRARAGALLGAARLLAYWLRLDDARALSEQSFAIYQQVDDRWNVAHARLWIGIVASCQGDYPCARQKFEECVADFHALGDLLGVAWSVRSLGSLAFWEGKLRLARELFEQALGIARRLNDPVEEAMVLGWTACLDYYEGDLARSRSDGLQSLALLGHFAIQPVVNFAWWILVQVSVREGHLAAARSHLLPLLAFCRDQGVNWDAPHAIESASHLMAVDGDAVGALRLAGAAAAFRAAVGKPLPLIEAADLERALAPARQTLSDAEQAQAWVEGAAMTVPQAIQYALDLLATAPGQVADPPDP